MKTLTVSAFVCTVMVLATAVENTDLGSGSGAPLCLRNWTEISGRCFYYVAESLRWADAELNCQAIGANLASVHGAEEYLLIQTMIVKLTQGFGRTWLGGCQMEGIWFWSDGTPFKYRHCGIFDNHWWKHHCLQMNYGANKCWDDEHCFSKLPSVCAKKP